jgi:RNA polymerase sigma-54 factor
MAFTAKLELRQSHSLVMTPQLQQAIKLLQLSNMELTAFVEAELERNPLLEREESDDTGGAQGEASQAEANLFDDAKQEANGHAGDPSDASEGETSGGDDGEWLDLQADDRGGQPDDLDTEPQDVSAEGDGFASGALKESSWASLGQGPRLDGDDAPNLEAYVAEERTLKDHLADQLALVFTDPAMRLIGHHLIDMTDEAGYLQGDLDALC